MKQINKSIYRAVLRLIPILPGPELYDILLDLSRSRTTLGEKIDSAYEALRQSSNLISELEDELADRVDTVEKLKKEHERYSSLAEIDEDKARALLTQLEITIGRGKAKERLIAFGINLLAGIIIFGLGILLGPYIKQLLGIN